MGIQGLLPLMKSIMNPIHVKELEGCFIAVDTYSWLHKGAFSCSTELCKGQPTTKHIEYCMHRVNMLRHYGVKPILVFDGGSLPMKSEQEAKRARSRVENLSRAMEHESNGNLSAAHECYQKAVDISPSIAYDLIQVLKQENVSYVVAPYEADAEMTFLAINKHVEAVITEDSDLIPFGCPRIIYKMDKFGHGVEFNNARLQHNKDLHLSGFTQMMFLEMCILSGCDYLQSLPGMGLKRAHALIKKFKSHDKVIKHLHYSGVDITPLYQESFKKAILTFKHQRVYDPSIEDIVHLSQPVDISGEDLDFLGPSLPQHVARGIACGDLDPFTGHRIQRESETHVKELQGSYNFQNIKLSADKKWIDLPAQRNHLTNYFCFASVDAKAEFKTPRYEQKHQYEVNKTSSTSINGLMVSQQSTQCMAVNGPHESLLDRVSDANDKEFVEPNDHGLDKEKEDSSCTKIRRCTTVSRVASKPYISVHRDFALEQQKRASRNRNVIIRSCYFMKNSEADGKENKDEKGYLDGEAIEKVSKSINIPSKNPQEAIQQNDKGDTNHDSWIKPILLKKPEDGFCKPKFRNASDHLGSLHSEDISDDEGREDTDSTVKTNNEPSSKYLSGSGTKKRKNTEAEISKDGTKNFILSSHKPCSDTRNNSVSSETYFSDLEEDGKSDDKFGCNISHLGSYTDIAEKSMDKFISMLSSYTYNNSGCRASGLRAPLKEIRNSNSMRSTTTGGMDFRKFACTSAKLNILSGGCRTERGHQLPPY